MLHRFTVLTRYYLCYGEDTLRKARIYARSELDPIMAREIKHRDVFDDGLDRSIFLERIENIILETDIRCYAWALIPNHFHLLLKTGRVPIATVMRRLLTGHAGFLTGGTSDMGICFKILLPIEPKNYILDIIYCGTMDKTFIRINYLLDHAYSSFPSTFFNYLCKLIHIFM